MTHNKKKTVYNVKYDHDMEKYIVVSRTLKTKNPVNNPHHRCYFVSMKSAKKEADKRNETLLKIRTFKQTHPLAKL